MRMRENTSSLVCVISPLSPNVPFLPEPVCGTPPDHSAARTWVSQILVDRVAQGAVGRLVQLQLCLQVGVGNKLC
jgi:hypothetical protein